MMDVSLRRSVCLMGSVLAVILLLAWPCYAAETTPAMVYFYPSDAVRGYPLDVIAFVGSTAECTLTMSKADAFTLPSSPATNQSTDSDWIWTFDNQLSVRVLVKPTLEGPYLNVSVKCGESETKDESVTVVSDVDMVAAWSSSPSPADTAKPLAATLTLTNQGGHTAVNVSCTATSAKNSSFTLTCGEKDPAQAASPCQLGSVRPHTSVLLKLNFESISNDDNVTVQCAAHNVVNASSLLFPFEILLKGDANITITHFAPAKVPAGLDVTVETTIKNQGRAKADNLTCELVIDKPESNVLVGLTEGKCELVQSATNVTTGARCAFGDLESQANATVSLVLHVDAAAKANDFNLAWSCGAESLARVNESITIPTPVEGNFTLVLPTNSSIAAGTQALLFRMKNPGPSFIRNGICNFTLPNGVKSDVWSQSKYFKCDKDETKKSKTMLNCVIEELPPGDTEFNLSLTLEDITLEEFFVDVKCQMLTPAISYEEEFTAYVGVVPSPSPTPSGSGQAPDNSMMVVVTVIVAVGLLIVIAIWWRRRQESSGWDAAGPTARSPSLNRFTDMELSVRSDD